MREQWRKWAQARRDRMTPEQLKEESAKARARKVAQRATPEGLEKHREQSRSWRKRNAEKVAKMRENEKLRKRERAAALRAERERDPEYIKAQELKKEKAKEKSRSACARYRERRKKRFAEDVAFSEDYKKKQKQYRENTKARLMADPEWQAKQAEKAARAARSTREPRPKTPLTEKEREERARWRREEKARAQRLLNAQKMIEQKAREAERAQPPSAPARQKFPIRKMGRLTALLKWHGR